MKNKKIVIAGGTGFIGQALAARYAADNEVVILSRSLSPAADEDRSNSAGTTHNRYDTALLPASPSIRYVQWDGLRVEKEWAREVDGCDLLINLAGRSVNCRYTARNKKEILDSRIDSTRALGLAVRDAIRPPAVWINSSSATIYPHAENHPQDENSPLTASDFSVNVCKAWEKAFDEQRAPFTRKITLRTAITLGDGGVIIPFFRLARWWLGGRQGNGRQRFSWVHIDDLAGAIEWLYTNTQQEGIYNLASPYPVTNSRFMEIIRSVTGVGFGLPIPAWLLKAGARLIGTETELLLKSRWVLPVRLLEEGFVFRYPRLEEALETLSNKHRVQRN